MRIALDAMAGDFGPEPLVKGAIQAVEETRHHVILVGDAETLENILIREQALHPRLSIVHADTVIGMDEVPKASLRKKSSSLAVAADLVKNGEADAVVSAGNTGATLAMMVTKWRPLPGVSRPSLATIIPVPHHPVVLLDVGANIDCRPQHLYDFGVMGSIYAREIIGRRSPRVGLLNIGSEDGKGTDILQQTFKLLADSPLNFIGNVEGGDAFTGKVDVIVCDGLVGNALLKFGEGLVSMMTGHLRAELKKNLFTTLGAIPLLSTLRRFRSQLDASEYGGAPLLGVNGISIVSHGASDAHHIRSAIKTAGELVRHDVNAKIQHALNGGG
ncbi:MAG TPA: phosphate acyltransferase PlsX [Candidatus Sumerlaeota bacterium]|mgnify:CR=1 FL=1|nr:phosphate acyltransferase PlsX [Candidatus Sumerlaeota bacterium]HOR29257.1 phosphate acyltransferase PlsX [Candidatus Sumerlaeota bacterium]HPK03329.1 phosphate acyltransferase PlsX [Candidatus Sumerlaeota bacterium]